MKKPSLNEGFETESNEGLAGAAQNLGVIGLDRVRAT